MTAFIRKFARRTRGLEALQAVLLVGVAFVICAGLTAVWNNNKDKFTERFVDMTNPGGGTPR